MTKSLDLAKLLPKRYRDKTIDALIGNLFNQHLSKPDAETFHGYIGSTADATATDIYLDETDIERQANQLAPALYIKAATDEDVTSWSDLVQRMNLLGISYNSLADWLTIGTHNFVPPIDIDKFVNFQEYMWVGKWMEEDSSLPWADLELAMPSVVQTAMARSNPENVPDYYVVERDPQNFPQITQGGIGASDWAICNMWVHKDDALAFFNQYGSSLTFASATAAKRPIIEVSKLVQLNMAVDADGAPADFFGSGATMRLQVKTRINQPVQLDLYYHNGEHAHLTSAGFFYKESPDADVDEVLGRRVVKEGESFVFQHGFTHPGNGRMLWFKSYEGAYVLRNMWAGHAATDVGVNTRYDTVEYLKYSTIGTVLNLDKLTNFQDYFWVNATTAPEYNTIAGGTSDWALENAWVHVASLTYDQRLAAVPAARPIIEFNSQLDGELLSTIKTVRHELPRFRVYRKTGPDTLTYPTSYNDPAVNDSYTNGVLFARLVDLDPDVQQAILGSSELSARLLVKLKGEFYVQSLANGVYRGERDGVEYGFSLRTIQRSGQGDGQILVTNIDPVTAVPRLLKLEALDSTTFQVSDYKGTIYSSVTVGVPYTLDGVEFTLLAGAQPFAMGDKIVLEVRSVVYDRLSLYCKLDNEFKTFTSPDGFLSDAVIRKLVPADVAQRDGAWIVHPAMSQNLDSSNGGTFIQSDLVTHFASIIEAQEGIEGNAFGRNNWRDLTDKRYAMGGLIKQIDERLALFLSTLVQPGVTPTTLLEVSKLAYDEMLSRVREYVEDRLIDDAVAGNAVMAGETINVDQATIDLLIKYLEGETFAGDLGVGRPYFDTTMPIKALTLTGPYLGLSDAAQPAEVLDDEQGLRSLLHHDNHMTPYPSIDEGVIKRLVMKLFTRSTGQVTPGVVTGPTPPQKPFAKQLWLDLSSMTLFIFDVVGDKFEQPSGAAYGAFTFDRETGEVAEYDGATWTSLGADQITQDSCWRKVDLAKTLAQLTLGIETILYNHAPQIIRYDQEQNVAEASYQALMKKEFESFASKNGIIDPYASIYVADNPFTWNYKGNTPAPTIETWQELYNFSFGTARPDLEPWVMFGQDEATWIAYLVGLTILPPGTTEFDAAFWPGIWSQVQTDMVTASIPSFNPGALPINPSSGELIPPFTFGAYGTELVTAIPPTPAANFTFGSRGPVELLWSRTTDYQLALGRSAYRLDPLNFTEAVWGDDQVAINGYRLLESTGNKARIQDVLIHGRSNTDTHPGFVTTASALTLPTYDVVVKVTILRNDTAIMEVEGAAPVVLQLPPPGQTESYQEATTGFDVTFELNHPLEGYRVGAVATITVDALGGAVIAYTFPAYDASSGLSQVMIHSLRRESVDVALTQALTRLTAWEPRLSYRFNALIDTESLLVKLNDDELTKSNIRVLLDEGLHKSSQWFSALKVTLFRKGAAERVGNIMIPAHSSVTNRRGDDWAFRVDVMSQVGPGIQWYTMTGPGETFMALGGKHSVDEWLRPETKGALHTSKGPFLITGIQTLVNFLWGYAVRQHELGFRAGGTDEPVIDAEIGRTIDWQLLIEQTVDKQFTGISEGAVSVLNPFSEEFAFVSPFGVVTSFADPITDESLTPMLLDINGKRLPPGSFRVFRQGTLTTANFDQEVVGVHVMTSAYEHVVLLPYIDGSKLVFSPFLGQAASRLFLTGERQKTKHGRLEFGGKFLRGHEMSENIEASVGALRNLYDTASLTRDTPRAERVRAMLGFHEQDYFDQRGTSSASEFRFFQGLLRSKGTNSAIDAYLNSRQFRSAYLDEYWAYKVASYGDGRPVIDVDLKVGMEDFTGDYANFLFLEDDELDHLDDWAEQMGYDVPNYDVTPYDGYSIYGPEQIQFVEYFDPNGAIIIRPDNQARWYRYTDANQLRYLEADTYVDIPLFIEALATPYRLKTKFGELVRADTFEILVTTGGYAEGGYDTTPYDVASTNLDYLQAVHREPGDYIPGTNPAEYATPMFRRINHSTIIVDDASLLGLTVIVRCYGPALSKFTPAKLYRYKPEVIAASDDIIWWDPARGYHHPEAFAHVDHVLKRDPAIYNESLLRGEGTQVNARRPWGEEQVGKVWWDMSKTAWLPYSDTRIYPALADRLAAWGGIAHFADLKLYEWVEASVPPAEYRKLVEAGTTSGEVGMGRYLYRDRTWEQRPVAWLYSANPQQTARQALAYQTDALVEVEYNGKMYLTSGLGSMPAALVSGVKVAGALYSENTRLPAELVKPIGQLLITSDDATFITGSATNYTAPSFQPSASFHNLSITLLPGTLLSIKAARGPMVLDSELVDGVTYARATFPATGLTQRITIDDTPAKAGIPYELVFDNLGVKVACTTGYGHADTWPVAANSESLRRARVAAELCNPAHSIVVREALSMQVQIPTNMAYLPGSANVGTLGWIAWNDPVNLSSDNLVPLNKYEPLFGDWLEVGTRLAELTSDIKLRRQNPWTTRSGDTVTAYRDVWTRWKLFKDYVAEAMYTTVGQTHDQAMRATGFTDLPVNMLATAKAYVNGKRVLDFTPIAEGSLSYLFINPSLVRMGDSVRVVVPAYEPSSEELGADLSSALAEPSATREFKLDVPFVKLEERNEQGRVSKTRYFYWVTGKEDQGLNKRMSTLLAQNLLRNHDGGYAVPQVFKSFNQVDGRPNRYAMLCVRGVSHLVGADDTFRLRLTRDPGMRQSSEDNHLKVRHNEWMLIRPNQATRIPKELWDKLTDTLCAETVLGVALPYVQLYEHDETSDVKASYGLGEGQVLTDRDEAKATVIGTLSNTRVVRFDEDTESFVPDPVSYAGFDLSMIEARMATPADTRILMGELWTNAKPKQLNELFFAVLEDALAKTTELVGIFKTSYIGLGEVRTLEEAKLSVSDTMFGTVEYEPAPIGNFILLEDDGDMLDESGDPILFEDEVEIESLLIEDGGNMLDESGDPILLEDIDTSFRLVWDQTSNVIEVPAPLTEFTITAQNAPAGVAWNMSWTFDGPGPTLTPDLDQIGTAILSLNYADSGLWLSAGTATITATSGDQTSNELVIHVTEPKETLEPDVYLSGVGTFESVDEIPHVEIMVGINVVTIPSGVSQMKVNGVGGDGVQGGPVFEQVGQAQWPQIVAGEESVLLIGDGSTLLRNQYSFGSANDWETLTRPAGEWNWTIFGSGPSAFVAFPEDNTITWVSDDNGTTWAQGTIPASSPKNWEAVAYGDGLFVALEPVGTKGYTSPDGLTWTQITVPNTSRRRLTFGNGKFVASEGGNTIVGTLSGGVITWAQVSTPLITQPLAIIYGDNLDRWVISDYSTSNGYYSDDCITWTPMTTPRDGWITGTYGAGRYVLGNNDSSGAGAAWSDDGVTWNVPTIGEGNRRFAATLANEIAMLAGGGNMTLNISNDGGETWYPSEKDPQDGPSAYVVVPSDNITLGFEGGVAGGPADPRAEFVEAIDPGGVLVSHEVPTGSYAALSYFEPILLP
jgi:hypothetical protein